MHDAKYFKGSIHQYFLLILFLYQLSVVEYGYSSEIQDSLWKTEIFGHRCAVFTPTLVTSPKGSFHSLSSISPSKRKAPRIILRELPWESHSFVIVSAPSVHYLHPDLYLISNRSLHTISDTLIKRVWRILRSNVKTVQSSQPLHRVLHRFGLSVSIASWQLWDLISNSNNKINVIEYSLLELISSDIVAAAVKRVVRFHSW